MMLRSRKRFNKRLRESLGLQIIHKKIMIKVTLIGRRKDRARITNLVKTSPSCMKRKVMII